ncbi:acyltransferase family protein [Companilactobacillus furfuricola]|uniref:acyltransferase family protein n=1 Tax=Companilactobacillus furfuricola TaxID=1462575 RepID=UPI000F79A271|nr:acyltransferase [Companilactobacillus furfuricola]
MPRAKRNSAIEMLRIFSMILITLHHFSLWGQGSRSDQLIANGKLMEAFESLMYLPLGDIGVYVFVMITGFYLSKSVVSIRKSGLKIKSIYSELLFYDFLFLLVGIYFHLPLDNFPNLRDPLVPFNHVPNIMKSVFPILFNHYWFVTAFIILLLLVPYLNRNIQLWKRSEMGFLILILAITCGVFPLLNNNVASETVGLGIVITAYYIGAYIRIFLNKSTKSLILGIFLVVVNILIIYTIAYFDIVILKYRFIKIYTGFFAMLAASGLFMIFTNIKPFYNPVINFFSKHVFAVYLITENVFMIKPLWKYFGFSQINDIKIVNVCGFLSVVLITVVCILFDSLRSTMFKAIIVLHRRIRSIVIFPSEVKN